MLTEFINIVRNNKLFVDSIIITKNGKRDEYVFTNDKSHKVRSISKTISCLGAFVAIENGLYNLDTNVLPFFDRNCIFTKENIPFLEELKIKHLMNLTIGQEENLMFSKDINGYTPKGGFISYILNYPIKHMPGEYFKYTNAATYLLCAITQKLTKTSFRNWIQYELFNKMDVKLGKWETKDNICLGGTGLSLTNNDLHKIALFLLNEGNYKGIQLISKEHIQMMHSPQFFTAKLQDYVNKQERCINKMSYGYGLWICGDGSKKYPRTYYFSDGTDGQFLIVSPNDKMTITLLSHQVNMEPIYDALKVFFQ